MPYMLIRRYTISVFSYSKFMLKNRLLYCTKSYIQCLPAYLPFLLSKMQFYQKNYHEGRFRNHLEEGPSSNTSKKSSLWESYDAQSKRTCSIDFLQAPQLGHSFDPPPYYTYTTPQITHGCSNETFKTI